MKRALIIIGICIIWSNTLCAQITVSPRTEKMDFVNLLRKNLFGPCAKVCGRVSHA